MEFQVLPSVLGYQLSTWGGTFYVSKDLGFLYNNHLRSNRTVRGAYAQLVYALVGADEKKMDRLIKQAARFDDEDIVAGYERLSSTARMASRSSWPDGARSTCSCSATRRRR